MSFSNNNLISSIPYFAIAILSSPQPNAKPEYIFESIPQFSSTFGCTIPQPKSSIQPSFLHTLHPFPLHTKQDTSTSALGSVYGK